MNDNQKIEETCLYTLSTMPGFDWFRNIVLVSSQQDSYVSYDSARIQVCKQALTEKIAADHLIKDQANPYITMAKNLFSNCKTKLLYRIDVNF